MSNNITDIDKKITEDFEAWFNKLNHHDSIAAWMIRANLPRGVAKQIWFDATAAAAKLYQERIGEHGEFVENLQNIHQERCDKYESRIKELKKYIIDEDICCCDSQHQYTCMKCEILGEKK